MITREDLIGAWRLDTWELIDVAGAARRTFGDAPPGLLVYTPAGIMTVAIMRAVRPRSSADDLYSCPEADKAAAAEGYFSYAGTFDLGEDRVFHRVAISLFPNWIGSTQERLAQLRGDLLDLRSPPSARDGSVSRILWRRVAAEPAPRA